jgi:type VI secretion system protein ImpF
MAKSKTDQWLLPSIIDRLTTEHAPGARGDALTLRGLKESVRRDIENLLNTRRRWAPWPEEYEELDLSVFNYGIPDFTGTNASSLADVNQFLRIIESAIRKFEPRFKSVRASLPEDTDSEDRVLRFRIEGLLHAEPAPEPVAFETEIEPGTGVFEVKSIR